MTKEELKAAGWKHFSGMFSSYQRFERGDSSITVDEVEPGRIEARVSGEHEIKAYAGRRNYDLALFRLGNEPLSENPPFTRTVRDWAFAPEENEYQEE